ncbi:DUF6900 domain-containing protein [Endozoicomonas montiporae]|uniref:DUF6900 domain-containing protein n=1 Tax=Endozoicomonas montiporae CL-33 TaxID=570277 RepID=A0A142BHM9_9GAMM|nr:hypothetical protein [Endozoicomonas montiporae]AMO58255.1 hypothetical protein EZMO1_4338 [Endozoicomonas montiporae CL-33]
MKEIISLIAKKNLQIETLERQSSDSLDFHDIAVWQIKKALMDAYQKGYTQGEIDTVNKRYGVDTARPCDNCNRIFVPRLANDHEQGWFCDLCLTHPEDQ